MPKAVAYPLPLAGIFAITKPSGPTCMAVVNQLRTLFSQSKLFMSEDNLAKYRAAQSEPKKKQPKRKQFKEMNKLSVKLGTGGTLDPLADGVLVLGVGSATKQLSRFLECSKEYRTTALLGCETDSYDSEGALVRTAPWSHVTNAAVQAALPAFTGEIMQMPPIYSAIKMDGRPLYEYARTGIPLPRPIQKRKCTVTSLVLTAWEDAATSPTSPGHHFSWPKKELSPSAKKEHDKIIELLHQVESNPTTSAPAEVVPSDLTTADSLAAAPEVPVTNTEPVPEVEAETSVAAEPTPPETLPPTFTLLMSVSGGTYVRSIVHDVGNAVDSAAHVVILTRTRQGEFVLDDEAADKELEEEPGKKTKPCVDWSILDDAIKRKGGGEELEVDEDGWTAWEREILLKWRG